MGKLWQTAANASVAAEFQIARCKNGHKERDGEGIVFPWQHEESLEIHMGTEALDHVILLPGIYLLGVFSVPSIRKLRAL